MTKKQKIVVLSAVAIIIISLLIWLNFGGKVFTQTKILINKKDELFGTTYKVWENKFVLGLDLTLVFDAVVLLISGILFFVFRRRKSLTE